MGGRVFLLTWILIVAGCGGKEKAIELERQRLTLDLMKAQNEQLATLTKKESDLRALERKNQEALHKGHEQAVVKALN